MPPTPPKPAIAPGPGADDELRRIGQLILQLDDARWAVEVLADAGVEALAIKGCALIGWIYEPGERAMADVDLIVRRRDRHRALRALLDAGFVPVPRPHSVTARWVYATTDFHSPRGTLVDVHHDMGPPPQFRIDHEGLFARAVAHAELGPRARRVCAEDFVVLMALDRSKDAGRAKPHSLEDLARVVAHAGDAEGLDWAAIAARTRAVGCANSLAVMIDELDAGRPNCGAGATARAFAAATLAAQRWRRGGLRLLAAPPLRLPALARRLIGGATYSDSLARYGAAVALYAGRSAIDVLAGRAGPRKAACASTPCADRGGAGDR